MNFLSVIEIVGWTGDVVHRFANWTIPVFLTNFIWLIVHVIGTRRSNGMNLVRVHGDSGLTSTTDVLLLSGFDDSHLRFSRMKLTRANPIPIPCLRPMVSFMKVMERARVNAGYNAVRMVVCPAAPPLRRA